MRPSVYVVLWATAVAGLPSSGCGDGEVPDVLAVLAGFGKRRRKRQSEWSWYSGYYNNQPAEEVHWTNPSRNPFDICETPEGKQLGAQCTGGSISADHTDGWYTDHTDVHFTSWTMGPPDKQGWNPFAPVSNTAGRTGTSGASRASTTANSGTLPVTNGG
ncbi:hypothetical protein Slin15195_G081790 [Septoria linicola]|uniref:Uncharacterized protein n=1 Tax=Septoria linicola TaxID=215465 RepID=A0A9Q9ATI1_9PEZI|nr:hypothetical protein Slin15195_G081790 [Septoria linicola]